MTMIIDRVDSRPSSAQEEFMPMLSGDSVACWPSGVKAGDDGGMRRLRDRSSEETAAELGIAARTFDRKRKLIRELWGRSPE
jgi:hypothetical protein